MRLTVNDLMVVAAKRKLNRTDPTLSACWTKTWPLCWRGRSTAWPRYAVDIAQGLNIDTREVSAVLAVLLALGEITQQGLWYVRKSK